MVRAAVAASLLLAATARGARAQSDRALARLFGAAPGDLLTALDRAAKDAHIVCHAARPSGDAVPYVCSRPPAPFPLAASATYWYEAGRLDSVFLVIEDGLPSGRLADHADAFWTVHRPVGFATCTLNVSS